MNQACSLLPWQEQSLIMVAAMTSQGFFTMEATVVPSAPAAMDEAECVQPRAADMGTDGCCRTKVAPPEKVAAKAYDIWLHKGCPKGCEMENWREAEEELINELHLS